MEKPSRDKLIEAALPLFARKGFAAVTIRELARAAGTNSALISYYFGGKEGLYAAVLEHQFAHVSDEIKRLSGLGLSPTERIKAYGRVVAAMHKRCPYLIRFLHSELTNPTPYFDTVLKKTIAGAYRFLFQTIKDGVADGSFGRDIKPEYAVISLAGMINFYFIARPLADAFIPVEDNRDENYVDHAINIYLKGTGRRDNE